MSILHRFINIIISLETEHLHLLAERRVDSRRHKRHQADSCIEDETRWARSCLTRAVAKCSVSVMGYWSSENATQHVGEPGRYLWSPLKCFYESEKLEKWTGIIILVDLLIKKISKQLKDQGKPRNENCRWVMISKIKVTVEINFLTFLTSWFKFSWCISEISAIIE